MRVRVNTEFVTSHVLVLQHLRVVHDARADDEKGRFETFGLEKGRQLGAVQPGTIIITVSIFTLVGTGRNVDVAGAQAACPPTGPIRPCRCDGGSILWITTDFGISRWNFRDGRPVNL